MMMKNRGRFVRTRSKHSTANAGNRGSPSLSAALIKVSSVKVVVSAVGPTDWCVDVTPGVTGEVVKKKEGILPFFCCLATPLCWRNALTGPGDRNSTGFPRNKGQHSFHLLLNVSVKWTLSNGIYCAVRSDRMKSHAVLCRRVGQRPSHGACALPLVITTCFGFLTRRKNIPARLPADLDRIPDTWWTMSFTFATGWQMTIPQTQPGCWQKLMFITLADVGERVSLLT